MADVTTGQGAASTPGASSGTAMSTRDSAAGGLQSEKGQTTIADPVVTKVAGIATREVTGVHSLGGGVARALGAVAQRLPVGGDNTSQGVSVEVGETEAAVDLTVVVDYGESIPKVAQQIRENVIRRIEGICGLSVTEVNVAVNDLYMPGDDQDEEPSRVQ
jgi:uncharacterized alkaline shock family protein YloU